MLSNVVVIFKKSCKLKGDIEILVNILYWGNKLRLTVDGSPYAMKVARAVMARYKTKYRDGIRRE